MGSVGPENSRPSTNRLFVHDIQIAIYHLRSVFSGLGDGLTVVAGSAAVVVFARYGILSLEPIYRQLVIAIAASVLAPYIYYVLAQRVAFFRSNSVLADLALDAAIARRYVFSIAFILCLAIIVALLLPDLSLMLNFFVSFCASLLIAALLSKAFDALQRRISYQKLERVDQLFASRYSGKGLTVASAGGAAVIFTAARFLDLDVASATATLTSFALGLWYSPIAYSAVEYERLIGLSPAHSLRTKLRDLIILGSALTGGASLSLQWQIASVVVAVSALLLLYKGLEVLVVRAVGGSRARIGMVLILFILVSVLMIFPFLVLLLAPACVWRLLITGRKRTWQIL